MTSKKNDIYGYVFHLWAFEDYLRAFPQHADAKPELHELNEMMHREGVVDGGHVQLAKNALAEMEELHEELMQTNAIYRAAILRLQPGLTLFKAKTDRPTMSDIEACLTLVYQTFLLRMQQHQITPQTEDVEQQAKKILELISIIYHDKDDNQATV